ncbi:hypothetical protein WUBG_02890 [Wuchereria bancrofti]|uniref:Uncharacterized protein n=1 Tax=Wuchereria bancrofti TaxID=6293 RepID=J9BFZ3_WUCBA|nr:hypothetical protein WUBG_02890 [Wuchereria bancrofti]
MEHYFSSTVGRKRKTLTKVIILKHCFLPKTKICFINEIWESEKLRIRRLLYNEIFEQKSLKHSTSSRVHHHFEDVVVAISDIVFVPSSRFYPPVVVNFGEARKNYK